MSSRSSTDLPQFTLRQLHGAIGVFAAVLALNLAFESTELKMLSVCATSAAIGLGCCVTGSALERQGGNAAHSARLLGVVGAILIVAPLVITLAFIVDFQTLLAPSRAGGC